VGHQHQRRAVLAVEVEQQIRHRLAGLAIEIAGRFVGEQQLGRAGEGACDRDALLLAAGQLARVVLEAMAQPDLVQRLERALARSLDTADLERQHHVFQRAEARQQVKRLEHEADPGPAQPRPTILVEIVQPGAGQPDPARARRFQPGQQPQQRGLARARGTDDRQRLPGVQVQTDILHDLQPAARRVDRVVHMLGQQGRVG
jgi:acyl-CoA thioesterase-1